MVLKTLLNKLLIVVLLLGTLLFPVTGCGSEPETTASPPAGDQVLTLYGIDPHTLDPAVSGDSTSHQYVTQVFSGLFRLSDLLEPRPDIAEDWIVSLDGRTYTFYLKKDAVFQDGTPVTAEAFKYSWERACYPATGSGTAATYLGDIVGADDVLSGKSTDISGIQVIDDHTLEVTIDSPRSYFLYLLTYPTTFVVDKNNVAEGAEWWKNPNGTGPFTLGEWTEGERIVLEWNPRYCGTTPRLNKAVFLLWSGVPMIMYETGEIDVAAVPVSYMEKVTDPAEPLNDELTVFPELSFYYIGFNTSEPPFDDSSIRKAFSMAIDREKITSLIYKDTVDAALGILPPGIPGHNYSLTGYGFDPETALQLIADSSYGSIENLPPITMTTSGLGGILSNDLEGVIDQWKTNLGVEVEVRQLEPDHYIYHLAEEKDNLFEMGWIADYPHPQDFLSVLFSTGAWYNYGDYSNPEADAILEKAGLEYDTETSLELYREAEQLLVDDAACIPLWFGENYFLIKPYVEGFYLNPLGIVMLDEVSIDMD